MSVLCLSLLSLNPVSSELVNFKSRISKKLFLSDLIDRYEFLFLFPSCSSAVSDEKDTKHTNTYAIYKTFQSYSPFRIQKTDEVDGNWILTKIATSMTFFWIKNHPKYCPFAKLDKFLPKFQLETYILMQG